MIIRTIALVCIMAMFLVVGIVLVSGTIAGLGAVLYTLLSM